MTEQNPVQIDPDLTNVVSTPLFTKKTVVLTMTASAIVLGTGIFIGYKHGREMAEIAQEIVHETAADVADATK